MSQFTRRMFLGGTAATSVIGLAGVSRLTQAGPEAAGEPPVSSLHYGPAPGVAKLDANENPYGPSPAALREIQAACQQGAYYADAAVARLKAMIAERHGLTPAHVALSAGSSGMLTYAAMAAAGEGRILGPDLFWDTTAKMGTRHGGDILRLPKSDDLAIDLEAMDRAISDEVAMVQITNPNNPTGLLLGSEALRSFCKNASARTTVLVDEAYNELTDNPEANSMAGLVGEGYNVIVARTFSKIYGLAGLRVGYTLAAPETTARLNSYGLGEYALNQAGLAAAIASYDDQAFLAMSKARINEAKERVTEAIRANGLRALPSSTNFMFVDLGDLDAGVFREQMARHRVFIRGIYRDYTHWSRVSMGRPEAVAQYAAALPRVLEAMRA